MKMMRILDTALMLLLLLLLSLIILCYHTSNALVSPTPDISSSSLRNVEAKALAEWLLAGGNDRFSSTAVELAVVEETSPSAAGDDEDEDEDKKKKKNAVIAMSTTRSVNQGEVLFRLGNKAIWSAASAFQDKDLGPKLRDYALKAGPGFGVVALSGVLATEKIRRFRSREGLGTAPESAGFMVPSKWGVFARYLWSNYYVDDGTKKKKNVLEDESLSGPVMQGVDLLLPMLDVAARRSWSVEDAPEGASFFSDEWARKAMTFDDGASQSWSRSDLEDVAKNAFGLVLEKQRSPPPYLMSGVGSLIPEPFLDKDTEPPKTWPCGEEYALLPLVDDLLLFVNQNENKDVPNAVLGSPPLRRVGSGKEDECLWCVAMRKLDPGERIIIVAASDE